MTEVEQSTMSDGRNGATDIDWDLFDRVRSYGWAYKLVNKPDESQSKRDIQRINQANEYLLEYLTEQDKHMDVRALPDGMIVETVTEKLTEDPAIDTTKYNIWQWIGGHTRLVHDEQPIDEKWKHIEEYEADIKQTEREAYREGYRDGQKDQ